MHRYWRNLILTCFFLLGFNCVADATDVNVIGLTNGKAVLSINGGRTRTLSEGETSPDGVKLISARSDRAVIEIDGKRETVTMGQTISSATNTAGQKSLTLTADSNGHFLTIGTINGATVRFFVDTGASMVAMSSEDATRAGIDYTKGERVFSSTANGVVPVYKVKLDVVKVGDITLNNIDGTVHTQIDLPVVLLGMSFLNRLEMKREGSSMALTKKY